MELIDLSLSNLEQEYIERRDYLFDVIDELSVLGSKDGVKFYGELLRQEEARFRRAELKASLRVIKGGRG